MSLTELAKISGVSEKTIRRCEAAIGRPPVTKNTLQRLQTAFNARNVVFRITAEEIQVAVILDDKLRLVLGAEG